MRTLDDPFADLAEVARRFANRELGPHVLSDDRYPFAEFRERSWSQAAELGLAASVLPEPVGGGGLGMAALATTLEAVAAVDGSRATVLFAQSLARAVVLALEPSARVLHLLALEDQASDPLIGYPLYEDPEELSQGVRATQTGQGFVLQGELAQVACLPVARCALVPALLEGQPALFILETDQPGVVVGQPLPVLGLRACPLADLQLDKVFVPADLCLDNRQAGRVLASASERFRPALIALSLGILRGSFELALRYARDRYQAKKQIIEHHMVQEMLAGMLMVLQSGQLALFRACELADTGASRGELVSLHEYVTSAVARATTDGVQVLGGNGYIHEYGQEKRMRDAKQLQAVFGSSATRSLRVIERHLQTL